MISAIILTLNEERNIVDCIRTLREWCNDVVVFDSFSTDRTVELAEREGARVFRRRFDNYASQRNAALTEVSYPGEWGLMVDADERWGKKIGEAISAAVETPEYRDCSILHFRRRDIFRNRWLKHNIGAGTWSGRLLRLGKVTVSRDINEEYHCDGAKGYLHGVRFDHYPFNNGISWWLTRHNRYSDMEAVRLLAERRIPIDWKVLLGGDPILRRKQFKQLIYRIPFRPIWMFCFLALIRGGILDGAAGLHYSILRSFYEYMINLKITELKTAEQQNTGENRETDAPDTEKHRGRLD